MIQKLLIVLLLCLFVFSCDSIQHLKVSKSDSEFHNITEKGRQDYQQFDIRDLIHIHVQSHIFQENLLNIEFVIVNNGDRTISYEVDKLHVSLNKKKLVFERVARDSKTYFGSKNSKVVELKKASKKFIIPAGRRIKINYSLKTKNPDEVITLNSPIRVSNSGFIINRKRDKLSFNLNPKN